LVAIKFILIKVEMARWLGFSPVLEIKFIYKTNYFNYNIVYNSAQIPTGYQKS